MSLWPLARVASASSCTFRCSSVREADLKWHSEQLRTKRALLLWQDVCVWSIQTVACKGQAGLLVSAEVKLVMSLDFASWSAPSARLPHWAGGAGWSIAGYLLALLCHLVGAWLQGKHRECPEIKTRLISFTLTHLQQHSTPPTPPTAPFEQSSRSEWADVHQISLLS